MSLDGFNACERTLISYNKLLLKMLQPRDADNGVPSITAPWPVQDIIYVAIIAPIMLAAFLEWILFLVAFQYCFVQVFRKADVEHKWSVRILCVLNMGFSMLMRCIFLPIMVVTLPLPSQVVQYFPQKLVDILQWFAFVSLTISIAGTRFLADSVSSIPSRVS